MSRKREQIDFEASIKELEALVARMEGGNLTLEESLKDFERGVALARACQKALAEAEQKVRILTNRNGEGEPEPFKPEDLQQ